MHPIVAHQIALAHMRDLHRRAADHRRARAALRRAARWPRRRRAAARTATPARA